MLLKALLISAVLLVVWAVFFRRRRPLRRLGRPRVRNPFAERPLVRCRTCGIYLPAGERCDCGRKD